MSPLFALLFAMLAATAASQAQIPLRRHTTLTAIDGTTLVATMDSAYEGLTGKHPSPSRLAMGVAMVWFENGHGRKLYNWGMGNIGAGEHEPYYVVGGSRFAVRASPALGARAYWDHLRERCSLALSTFDYGDTDVVSARLAACGYHRTPVPIYARGLRGLYWEALELVGRHRRAAL